MRSCINCSIPSPRITEIMETVYLLHHIFLSPHLQVVNWERTVQAVPKYVTVGPELQAVIQLPDYVTASTGQWGFVVECVSHKP